MKRNHAIVSYLGKKIQRNAAKSRQLRNFMKSGDTELSEFHLALNEYTRLRDQQKALIQVKRTTLGQN